MFIVPGTVSEAGNSEINDILQETWFKLGERRHHKPETQNGCGFNSHMVVGSASNDQ